MADYITGREFRVGVVKASAWRTAVVTGASSGVLVTSESMGAKAPTFVQDDSLGNVDIKELVQTSESLEGSSMAGYLRFEGWDVLMALALGTAGTPTQAEGTAYYNTYSPADNINDLFATINMKKSAISGNDVWQVPSAKITGFTISAEIGSLATITFNFMGNKIVLANSATVMSGWSIPDTGNLARMDANFKVRMNANSGGALADADKIYPFSFEVSYTRPFKANFEAGFADMSEPVQDGFAAATVRLTFDKYSLNDFMTAITNSTLQKMDILFRGNLITGTSYYQMRIDMPKIQFSSAAADVGGPGTIQHVVEGTLLAVESGEEPTGMNVNDPLAIYVMNTRTTDPLG